MAESGQPAGVAVDRGVMAPVPEREFECLGDPAICDNPRGCGCAPTPERTYTRAELLTALAAERHACSIVVWMTLMEALEPDADDKGLDGWMREAERRVKNRQYENDAMELGRELYAEAQDAVGRLSARVQELEAAEEGAKEAFGVVVQEKHDAMTECGRLRTLLDAAYSSEARLRRKLTAIHQIAGELAKD